MQISSNCKTSACDKCEASKENSHPEAHRSSSSSRCGRRGSLTKRRPLKLRQRRSSGSSSSTGSSSQGNYHQLDHTYAASFNSDEVKTIVIDDDDSDDGNRCTSTGPSAGRRNKAEEKMGRENEESGLKSTWLRNLCLDYQNGVTTYSRTKGQVVNGMREKQDCFSSNGINGTSKQYSRNREVDKSKAVLPSSIFGRNKTYLEEKKRWIAALALIELAQSN